MRCIAHVLHVLVARSSDSFVVTFIRCVAPQFLLVTELLVYCTGQSYYIGARALLRVEPSVRACVRACVRASVRVFVVFVHTFVISVLASHQIHQTISSVERESV